MNAYDFDKTIYDGDSTADFYFFCLKRHKSIILLMPSLLYAACRFYVFKRGTKTEFKEIMYRFLQKCDAENDVGDFWKKNFCKIKDFYLKQKDSEDVIISASPEFLLSPVCKKLGIKNLIASRVDKNSGKYDGLNCHGNEKVNRLYEQFGEIEIDEFYSDSTSDSPMAEIAKNAFLVKGNKIEKWKF